ncbi:MAG TPA: hypothetical protein VFJ51_05430 [Nitrososphaeraceae archaeon]|nr:hypothetical protein [Nitrososphaeraceae archaeon]
MNANNQFLDKAVAPTIIMIEYNDIIHRLEPAVIQPVTSVANMGWYEPTYLSFFGAD